MENTSEFTKAKQGYAVTPHKIVSLAFLLDRFLKEFYVCMMKFEFVWKRFKHVLTFEFSYQLSDLGVSTKKTTNQQLWFSSSSEGKEMSLKVKNITIHKRKTEACVACVGNVLRR